MRSIRITQYLEEYLNQLHNIYKTEINCILCTYYNLDIDASTCDKDKLYNGTWEYVGKYSGYKWKKIELFPIAYVSNANQMDISASEKGVGADITFNAVIPSSYGIKPHALDFLTLNSNILFPSLPIDETNFVVKNINRSNFGKKFFYQIEMKNMYINTADLDLQSDEYTFVELEKQIYPTQRATELLQLLSIDTEVNRLLTPRYIWDRGFYTMIEE